jgi:carboxypeptidase Taq
MTSRYTALLTRVQEIHDLQKASALLSWDRQVIMPQAGDDVRVRQITTLQRLTHSMFTGDEMGELIERAAEEIDGAPYDSNEASLIRYLRQDYEEQRRLPDEFVARVSEVSGKAHPVWVRAREENDFDAFAPWLTQIVDLGRQMAEYYGYQDHVYDPLLDKYERGATTAQVQALFDATKQAIVPLLEAVKDSPQHISDDILHQPFDVDAQKEFARYIAQEVGYDFERGYLGTAVHPFASSFSRNDARITSRWYPDYLSPSLFGTLHESGHAMYEQNTHPDLERTPLARGTSSGIHESQSRLFENYVGRSLPFWRAHFPRLKELFPAQLEDTTAEDFYRAVNKVQPSFIRVEADELTYNLHIILRFELEQALVAGDIPVSALPQAWNAKMESLLGVVPPTDRAGVLQDIHWTRPSFGYFPTYALGNLYAAQLFVAAQEQSPEISSELEQGRTGALLAWLSQNIHQHGRKFLPTELIKRATGEPLSERHYVAYATEKFSDIYNL